MGSSLGFVYEYADVGFCDGVTAEDHVFVISYFPESP